MNSMIDRASPSERALILLFCLNYRFALKITTEKTLQQRSFISQYLTDISIAHSEEYTRLFEEIFKY